MKRLNYGWVTLIAYLFLIGGSFALASQHTAGPGYGFMADAAVRAVFWGLLAPWLGPALAIWLAIIWAIGNRKPCWRRRTWVAIAPPLIFLIWRAGILVNDPPSPEKFFHETFAVALPADATAIEVAHPTLADPGFVDFGFICSRESAEDLIARMNLKPVGNEPRTPIWHFRVGNGWNWHEWVTAHHYAKSQRTGTGHVLVADAEMERILVSRNPLFGEPQTEDSQGIYSD